MDYSRSSIRNDGLSDVDDEFVRNPLQAFQLIKRLTVNWNSISAIMNDQTPWKSKWLFLYFFHPEKSPEDDCHSFTTFP